MSPTRRSVVALLAVALLVAGCSRDAEDAGRRTPSEASSTASPTVSCADVRGALVDEVQAYVDVYGPTLGTEPGGGSGEDGGTVGADDGVLRRAIATAQQGLREAGCDLDDFQEAFAADLERVTARGPLARAVKLRLVASLTGRLGQAPTTVRVRPSDDLARELSRLAPGSTVRLSAGRHRLRAPLVLLCGVTVRGAGRGRTAVTSTAAGSALLVLSGERTELRDVTLEHTGRRPASVLTGGPSSSVVLTDAVVRGARGSGRDAAAGAGSGITMTARAEEATDRGTTLQVTGTRFVDNAAAGILLSGAHRASIRGSEFRDNRQCAVCFTGSSSGAVRSSTFTDNTVGVAVLDRARPGILGNRFVGGEVAVQASGTAAPVVRRARVERTARAAMIFGGTSRGRVDGSRCSATPYGIVVTPEALPFLGRNSCDVARAGDG